MYQIFDSMMDNETRLAAIRAALIEGEQSKDSIWF